MWGPGDPNLLPRLIARARKGRLRIVGTGQNRVDLTFIRNAAHAHLLAADAMTPRRVSGEAYFISDGNPVILWEWINDLLRRLDIRPVKGRVPVWMAYTAGRCFESLFWLIRRRKEPPMTRFLAKALSCSHYYNIAKARRDFAYQPIVTNEQGLQEAAEYFLKNPPRS
jgi:nucleoside-diphosphate-sugar epimerase